MLNVNLIVPRIPVHVLLFLPDVVHGRLKDSEEYQTDNWVKALTNVTKQKRWRFLATAKCQVSIVMLELCHGWNELFSSLALIAHYRYVLVSLFQARNCYVALMSKYISSFYLLICIPVLLNIFIYITLCSKMTVMQKENINSSVFHCITLQSLQSFIALQKVKRQGLILHFMTYGVILLISNNNTCLKFSGE